MVVVTNERNEEVVVQFASVEVPTKVKPKSLELSTSDYSAISIDSHPEEINDKSNDSSNATPGCLLPVCVSVPPKLKHAISDKDKCFVKSSSLRRTHSVNSTVSQRVYRPGPNRTPSSDSLSLLTASANHKKPPTGLRRHESDRVSSGPQSGKSHQNNISTDTNTAITSDDVSIISNSEEVIDSCLIDLNCSDKREKETSAIKQLKNNSVNLSSKLKNDCYHGHTSNMQFGRWCDKPNSEKKNTSSSGVKKRTTSLASSRSSPSVFNRLSKDGKEKLFEFFHCSDYTDYMYQYRIQHTVGNVGDLAKQPQVLGREVPDPYITKPSSVCLMQNVKSVNPATMGFPAVRKLEENHKGSCPNLPAKQQEESGEIKKYKTELLTPTQHIISMNDYMEAYLPQNFTLPRIPSRSESSPALLGDKIKTNIQDSVSLSSQFDGEIVGVKHKLPTASAYNFSALCKPSVGDDVYGELKSGAFRSLNSPKKKTTSDTGGDDVVKDSTKGVESPHKFASKCDSHTSHSDKGCHVCNRITSLIHNHNKPPNKDEHKSASARSCKPYDEQSRSILYRLQKLIK